MMHRADENQKEIVKALEGVGASVYIASQSGEGFPDLVIGFCGKNYLMEVKHPKRVKLRVKQQIFKEKWKGQYAIVATIEQALAVIGCVI